MTFTCHCHHENQIIRALPSTSNILKRFATATVGLHLATLIDIANISNIAKTVNIANIGGNIDFDIGWTLLVPSADT